MKILVIQLFFTLSANLCYSQSLAGDWKGEFESTPFGTSPSRSVVNKMNLTFVLNKDSSYTVYSFTKGVTANNKDTTVVCKLTGQFSNDSLYLEEVAVVLPKVFKRLCLQKMALRIKVRKKITSLNGTWKCSADNTYSSGSIYFWRKNE